MKITIKSTLADIAPEVYQAVNYQTAKAIIEEHLKDSHVEMYKDQLCYVPGVQNLDHSMFFVALLTLLPTLAYTSCH